MKIVLLTALCFVPASWFWGHDHGGEEFCVWLLEEWGMMNSKNLNMITFGITFNLCTFYVKNKNSCKDESFVEFLQIYEKTEKTCQKIILLVSVVTNMAVYFCPCMNHHWLYSCGWFPSFCKKVVLDPQYWQIISGGKDWIFFSKSKRHINSIAQNYFFTISVLNCQYVPPSMHPSFLSQVFIYDSHSPSPLLIHCITNN